MRLRISGWKFESSWGHRKKNNVVLSQKELARKEVSQKKLTFFERSRAMKRAKKNQINRCFESPPKATRMGKKPESPPLTDQQKDEEVKRILLAAAEQKRKEKEVASLLKQFRGRYSVLDLLELIRHRFPWLLDFAIEKVERQKKRGRLSMNEIVRFEKFKTAIKTAPKQND